VELGRTHRPAFLPILEKVQKIGAEIVRPAAAEVDRDARFPHEAIAALRRERLLSAAIPEVYGGMGLTIDEIAQICTALGQNCSAAAMVYAMHKIQVASIVNFGQSSPYFKQLLVEMCEKQTLIASVTSEVGVGGDMRSSICAVESDAATGRFKVEKKASVISYGEHADALLLTARRSPESPPNDQVSVYLPMGDVKLERTGVWNTLGMRGTCSPSFVVKAEGAVEQVLPFPFADVAAQSMVPYSHITWSSLWLGIATDAVTRAHAFVRADARKRPGTLPFGGQRLAEASNKLQAMRSVITDAIHFYSDAIGTADSADVLSGVGCAIRWNNLKISASQMVVEIVREAMAICGMAGYSNDGKFSMGRQLRDAYSAQLMIANDRIHTTNANLMLVYKDD